MGMTYGILVAFLKVEEDLPFGDVFLSGPVCDCGTGCGKGKRRACLQNRNGGRILLRMVDIPAISELTDEELAQRGAVRESVAQRQRAVQAYEELYRRHSGKLLGFLAARVPRSDIEDFNQIVWKRVWEHLPTGFHGGNFRAWLHQIARNQIIDNSRKKPVGSLGDADANAALPASREADPLLEQERMEILQKCLEKLEEDLQLLVKARLSGDSYEEVCAKLELKPERAHKLFHEAKGRLTMCVEHSLS